MLTSLNKPTKMRHLPPPNDPAHDDALQARICSKPIWTKHRTKWQKAYENYRQHNGNPWLVDPTNFPKTVQARLKKLYDTRRSSDALQKIRDEPYGSCPVCGSGGTGDLDHYLPRETFAEFSILSLNLVPACKYCNSDGKGRTYRGSGSERFIHPYFDTWASNEIWRVVFHEPFAAATFSPAPLHGLLNEVVEVTRFHLQNVLGKQFKRSMEVLWANYPKTLSMREGGLNENVDFEAHVKLDHDVEAVTNGLNSWRAAFLRGLLADKNAMDWVTTQAIQHSQLGE
ncbi:hypothetical protein [Rhizobium sp. Rhizsp82]|uniref:hypothetical protein n=1 Tax=Rhizobium sp. Rhizsp82 TaxID=3243057 RepID=UPI0039B457DC